MLFLRLVSRIPLWVLYVFSDFAFLIMYYGLYYRRSLVRKNLQRAFPDHSKIELQKIERSFYRNLCDYGVETIKLLTISRAELRKRMHFKNAEIIKEFTDQNQSVIILASHQFNWEWLLAAGCFSLPVPVDFVYQVQKGELFNQFLLQCRTRFGGYPIIRNLVAREAIVRNDKLRATAIVMDQFPGHHNDKKHWAEFLNQETAFFQGIDNLINLTQSPVFYFSVKKVKRGFYETEGMLLAAPPFNSNSCLAIDQYVQRTEEIIRENPQGWLWSHNRWKRSRKESEI